MVPRTPACHLGSTCNFAENVRTGRLEIIAGPMFAGKTRTLIDRVQAAVVTNRWVVVYKPVIDTRHNDTHIHAHSGEVIPSYPLEADAPKLPHDVDVIAIDEAQFLTSDAIPRLLEAARAGVRVILAGLDLDASGRPFGPMPVLMAFADEVVKITGTCAKCQRPSTRTHRLFRPAEDVVIQVGGADKYEPRCVICFDPRGGT